MSYDPVRLFTVTGEASLASVSLPNMLLVDQLCDAIDDKKNDGKDVFDFLGRFVREVFPSLGEAIEHALDRLGLPDAWEGWANRIWDQLCSGGHFDGNLRADSRIVLTAYPGHTDAELHTWVWVAGEFLSLTSDIELSTSQFCFGASGNPWPLNGGDLCTPFRQ